MDEPSEIHAGKFTKVVAQNGIKLLVIARKVESGNWELTIQNEYKVCTNWIESFSSAKLALEAGVEAIEKEGVESFVDIEGFEYLFDENV